MKIKNGILKEVTEEDLIFDAKTETFNFTVPENITTIEGCAFSTCKKVQNIYLNQGLTCIDDLAFINCHNLKKIIIPKSVTSIGNQAFSQCYSLEEITIPENVTHIGYHAFTECISLETAIFLNDVDHIERFTFSRCYNLKNVTLPRNITTISERTFRGCSSLEKIVLPESVISIEHSAFEKCSNLRDINIPGTVTTIKPGAFSGTKIEKIEFPKNMSKIEKSVFEDTFLKCIHIPENITDIEEAAFLFCKSAKELSLHKNIKSVEALAFDGVNESLKLITPYGEIELKNPATIDIIINYLYLYANSILKEKYNNIDEFISRNGYILKTLKSSIIYESNAIEKFKNLFYKMRNQYNIPSILFPHLSLNTTKNFDFKVWNEIKDSFSYNTEELAEAFAEMIEIFGLFHKDEKQKNRIQQFKELFSIKSYIISEFHYNIESDILKNAFTKTIKPYYSRTATKIPTEFQIYLGLLMTEKQRKRIKKLTGTYGKEINQFFKENYELKHITVYELKEEAKDDEKVIDLLYQKNLNGYINFPTLHRIFDGCNKVFDPDFYNFFMENLDIILEEEKIQASIKDIQFHFKNMKDYYLYTSGSKEITIKQALDYINNQSFKYNPGNFEFQKEVKKAGVTEQRAFDYYQNIYEKNKIRKLYSLIRRSNVYEINGYTIKAELLRKDDPFSLLVGEKNYTNCCQIFGGAGQNCMAHATCSDDGGIFVTKLLKDGEWVLLTESWDWQNNNLYCHDNIEGTPLLTEGPEELKEAVAEAFRLDAEFIIKQSKTEIEDYIKKRKKTLEKSFISNKEEELKKLDELEQREAIKMVTSGTRYDDLGLSKYFKIKLYVNEDQFINGKTFTLKNFQPINYNSKEIYFDSSYAAYSDAKKEQYIMAGSLEDFVFLEKPLVPIYRDERRVVLEQENQIRDYTINQIKEMEKKAYPENMINHEDSTMMDFKDNHIYLGEDWYLIYEEKDENNIYISDLAKIEPALEDEKGMQNNEIMHTIYSLLEKYDTIEAELKEDTSYLLYLINKKLGYVEQIGDDVSYPYEDKDTKSIYQEEQQQEILRKQKTIRSEQNPNLTMHRVTFKKGTGKPERIKNQDIEIKEETETLTATTKEKNIINFIVHKINSFKKNQKKGTDSKKYIK